jgi:hypothetical protein
MKNFLAWLLAAAIFGLLMWEAAHGAPRLPRHDFMFCASDVGLFVPCREADRIRRMEWRI